jgi:hypothetical protein
LKKENENFNALNKTTNKADESFCSIDEFFDKVNMKQTFLMNNNEIVKTERLFETTPFKESENLLSFDDFELKLPIRAQEKEKELIITPKVEQKYEAKFESTLAIIREESAGDIDEHTLIMNRLISTNYIQKTAITNFVDRKNSK